MTPSCGIPNKFPALLFVSFLMTLSSFQFPTVSHHFLRELDCLLEDILSCSFLCVLLLCRFQTHHLYTESTELILASVSWHILSQLLRMSSLSHCCYSVFRSALECIHKSAVAPAHPRFHSAEVPITHCNCLTSL